jgi:peptidoglycan hydrolase-like protein with peptidoglycan-binding domain
MTNTTRRITALLAAGTMAAGVGLTTAPTAFAATPPASAVSSADEGGWTEYHPGQMAWDIAIVKYMLMDMGYFEPLKTVDGVLDERSVEALMDYQQETDLRVTGLIDYRTWEFLADEAAGTGPGDEDHTVSAIQTALYYHHGYDLSADGYAPDSLDEGVYGEATQAAVAEIQEEVGLHPDGEIDAATFHVLLTYNR